MSDKCCALILSETLALYKSFTYLLTYKSKTETVLSQTINTPHVNRVAWRRNGAGSDLRSRGCGFNFCSGHYHVVLGLLGRVTNC